ncbi:MAG: hypothetical protein ACJ8AW_06410 [Rhodopila sp.]
MLRHPSSFLLFDADWGGYVRLHLREILDNLRDIFPGGGRDIEVDGVKVEPIPSGMAAMEAFETALVELERGIADIEAAEAHYVERYRALLLQRETGWSRFCRHFPALWSAKERAAWNADEFLRKSPPVSAEDEADRFNDARDAGAALARRGGRRAATWLVQAWIARLIEDEEPCPAIKEAAWAYSGAQVSRSLAPGRRLVVAAAGQTVLLPVGREAAAAVSKPLLAWPGDLGAEFPVHIDAPVDFAAQGHADEIEYDGQECRIELKDWVVRAPLSAAGVATFKRYEKQFGKQVCGHNDTIYLEHAVPEGVESLRITRMPLDADRCKINIGLHYKPTETETMTTQVAATVVAARDHERTSANQERSAQDVERDLKYRRWRRYNKPQKG